MRIEIFSDLVCPWCYIGKRRLDAALAGPAGDGVELVWRAYQLYPGLPADGMARDEFMKLRFGSGGGGDGRRRLVAEAAEAGITMNFDAIERMPNTLLGHRLLHLARPHGVQHELAETLFRAYFEEGRDVGDLEVLLEAAGAQGLDAAELREALASGAGAEAVRGELDRADNIGVTGVPCFVLAGAFAIPGAQSSETMAQVITRARDKLATQA